MIEKNAHLRRKRKPGKGSQYIGVHWSVRRQRFIARFTYTDRWGNPQGRDLGGYKDEREAALAYDKVAIHFGLPTNILKKISKNETTGTIIESYDRAGDE